MMWDDLIDKIRGRDDIDHDIDPTLYSLVPRMADRPKCAFCRRRLRPRRARIELTVRTARGYNCESFYIKDRIKTEFPWHGYPPFCTMRCGLEYGRRAHSIINASKED